LIDALLALWVRTGATAWYVLLFLYGRLVVKDRDRIRLPGMLGFLIGAGRIGYGCKEDHLGEPLHLRHLQQRE